MGPLPFFRRILHGSGSLVFRGPVHTNPFSNENGDVMVRFQKDLRPHLSFSYRFRPSTLQYNTIQYFINSPQGIFHN